jgi:hypothetical protein
MWKINRWLFGQPTKWSAQAFIIKGSAGGDMGGYGLLVFILQMFIFDLEMAWFAMGTVRLADGVWSGVGGLPLWQGWRRLFG